MTTYTKQDFIAALSEDYSLERDLNWTFETDEGPDGAPGVQYGTMTTVLTLGDGIGIERVVGWQHPLHKGSQVQFDDEPDWDFSQLAVLDDQGAPMDDADLAELIELRTAIAVAPDGVFTDDETKVDGAGIDDGLGELEEFVISRDNKPDLVFRGVEVARVKSSEESGRWSTLKLFRTRGGKYVAAKVGNTKWQGEKTRYSGAVCNTEREVIDFFGHGWLSKDLYSEAGIDDIEVVD